MMLAPPGEGRSHAPSWTESVAPVDRQSLRSSIRPYPVPARRDAAEHVVRGLKRSIFTLSMPQFRQPIGSLTDWRRSARLESSLGGGLSALLWLAGGACCVDLPEAVFFVECYSANCRSISDFMQSLFRGTGHQPEGLMTDLPSAGRPAFKLYGSPSPDLAAEPTCP